MDREDLIRPLVGQPAKPGRRIPAAAPGDGVHQPPLACRGRLPSVEPDDRHDRPRRSAALMRSRKRACIAAPLEARDVERSPFGEPPRGPIGRGEDDPPGDVTRNAGCPEHFAVDEIVSGSMRRPTVGGCRGSGRRRESGNARADGDRGQDRCPSDCLGPDHGSRPHLAHFISLFAPARRRFIYIALPRIAHAVGLDPDMWFSLAPGSSHNHPSRCRRCSPWSSLVTQRHG